MKILTLILLLSGSGLFAFAQKPGTSTSFRLGLEGGVSPNVGTTQYANLGLTARFSLLAGRGYAYVGTGYMVSREGIDFQIPIRVGYKLYFQNNFSYRRNSDIIFLRIRRVMQVRRFCMDFP